MNPYYQNILPQQQILQANGKESIRALRMAPNSSALIADQTLPIVWKCVSDSLGNVSAEAFDITPHKDEEIIEKENLTKQLTEIVNKLNDLEAKYESFTERNNPTTNAIHQASNGFNEKLFKPAGVHNATDEY